VAHIVRYEVFERPSHSQVGPLYTIPLDLPRDQFQTEFWPAVQQQTESYRSFESLPRDKFERTDFPQQTPTYTVPAGLYNAEDIPAITQLSDSYWLRSTLPLDKFQRTDFAHAPPQWTIPLDLPRDLFQTEFWPSIEQSLRSFRSDEAPRLQSEFYTQPIFSWFDAPLDLKEAEHFQTATRQLTDSFRSKAAPVLDPHWTDFPQGTPLLTIPLDLPRDLFQTEFWPALEQSLRSFRSKEGSRLQSEFHTQPEFSWLSIPLNLFDPQDGVAVESQQAGSFRTRESLPVDKFERTDFPQGTPLLTIPLDLPRDLFETQFIPAIYQEAGSFRSFDHARLIPQLFTQPTFSWFAAPLSLEFAVTDAVAPTSQQAGSFRVRESLPVDKFERTDFPQGTPLLTIALDLPRDQFSTEFISAIYQQRDSFRVHELRIVADYKRTDFPQQGPLFTVAIEDVYDAALFPGIQQLVSSFRSKEGPFFVSRLFISPINAWWTEPALRILGEPTVILLAKTRNFIIDAKGPNPIILSTGRPASVKDS